MRASDKIRCEGFPCQDVKHDCFAVPGVNLDPRKISILLISEAAPQDLSDSYYAGPSSLFAQTTLQAFNDAGIGVSSVRDILKRGVYLTTAVKCGKTGYGIATPTIKACSLLLEQELSLFPSVKAYLLMGDVAIKAMNEIARRNGEPRVIPAGSTYKLRGPAYHFRGARVLPSYLQAGPSFFIEKSKRKMIAEDMRSAFACL